MERVEVIAIRPHIERQRRNTGDTYKVHPERADYLINAGRVKIASEAAAEAEAEAEANVLAEIEAEAAEAEKFNAMPIEELLENWGPRQSPEKYIERWPKGPHSAHARAILTKLAEEA